MLLVVKDLYETNQETQFLKRVFLILFLSLVSSMAIAQTPTYPRCNEKAENQPCFAEWVAEDASFFMGLINNGLLNGRGAAVYPDGSKYIGDFRSGRRHGYGVFTFDEVPKYKGYVLVGVMQNGGSYGNTYASWPTGDFYYGFHRGGAMRSDRRISDFSEWRRAFYDLAAPQRKAIQTFLSDAQLTSTRKIYNSSIDGVWGRNTLNALVIYAALMKPEHFNLQDYRSAQSILQDILVTGATHSPFGYIIGSTTFSGNDPMVPACPENADLVSFKCFGSKRLDNGFLYVGDLILGVPNGSGKLIDGDVTFSGEFQGGEIVGDFKVEEDGIVIWEGTWAEFSQITDDAAQTDDRDQNLSPSSGSGFFVSENGHVVSNNHVVEGCSFVTGTVRGQKEVLTVLATDPVNDLSLLYNPELKGTPVVFKSTSVDLGDDVWVAGFPFGDNISSSIKLTKGVVSSLTGIQNDYTKFQIDAAMQPGNSGGPVLSSSGELIGVSVYKLDADYSKQTFGVMPENTNFAINNQIVKMFLLANRIDYLQEPTQQRSIGNTAENATVFIGCNR